MHPLRFVLVLILALGLQSAGIEAFAASLPLVQLARERAAQVSVTPIQVFFSKHGESDDDFTAVYAVPRVAFDRGVARAALRYLIEGPTEAEAAEGYYSELGSILTGPSSCFGHDFQVVIRDGLATVRFCRSVSSAGIGQDARTRSQIEATLRQFSTVIDVRLLTRDGHCLFDASGLDLCLQT